MKIFKVLRPATCALTVFATIASAQGARTPTEGGGRRTQDAGRSSTPLLIRNATVLTVTKGTLQNADILVEHGKIARLGQNLAVPAGAQVIDASGKYVMP